jgi:hypothetical protein
MWRSRVRITPSTALALAPSARFCLHLPPQRAVSVPLAASTRRIWSTCRLDAPRGCASVRRVETGGADRVVVPCRSHLPPRHAVFGPLAASTRRATARRYGALRREERIASACWSGKWGWVGRGAGRSCLAGPAGPVLRPRRRSAAAGSGSLGSRSARPAGPSLAGQTCPAEARRVCGSVGGNGEYLAWPPPKHR